MIGWLALVGLVLAPVTSAAAATLADYPDFSDTTGLQLNGDAAQSGSVLRLTEASATETGTAFTTAKGLRSNRSFKTDFRFHMHDTTTIQGDGMAFLIHGGGKGVIGDTGGGLGYGNIGDSLAVEFDTFDNGDGDDSPNEVAVITNGKAGKARAAEEAPFALYGGERRAWVKYQAPSHRLKVFVSDTDTKPDSPLISVKTNLEKVLDGRSRAGFTAATGGANAVHDVVDWKLTQ